LGTLLGTIERPRNSLKLRGKLTIQRLMLGAWNAGISHPMDAGEACSHTMNQLDATIYRYIPSADIST